MPLFVVTNAYLSVNGVDLSDHTKSITFVASQETREATCMGASARNFRAALQNPSVSAVFRNDSASGSVEATLRALVSIASTGFEVITQKITASTANPTSTSNPKYVFSAAIIDGDLNLLDAEVGEIPDIAAKFVPFAGAFTVTTTAS